MKRCQSGLSKGTAESPTGVCVCMNVYSAQLSQASSCWCQRDNKGKLRGLQIATCCRVYFLLSPSRPPWPLTMRAFLPNTRIRPLPLCFIPSLFVAGLPLFHLSVVLLSSITPVNWDSTVVSVKKVNLYVLWEALKVSSNYNIGWADCISFLCR